MAPIKSRSRQLRISRRLFFQKVVSLLQQTLGIGGFYLFGLFIYISKELSSSIMYLTSREEDEEAEEMYPRYRNISPTTLLVFITIFVFSSFSLANSVYRSNYRKAQNESFDILIFTQNWPVSVCDKFMEEGKSHQCDQFPPNSWTIHGLWPTKFGIIGPNFCNKTRPFSPEAIYGIEEQLNKYWSRVEHHASRYMFWAHEWEKHGTCASVLPQFATEFDYFYQVLDLYKKYSMNEVLQKAGISPGQRYNVTQIWDGVRRVLQKNPQVVCFEEKGNTSVLLEVRICFDKSLNLVDCDGTVVGLAQPVGSIPKWWQEWRAKQPNHSGYHNLTNCKTERLVQYPPGVLSSDAFRTTTPAQEETNPLIEKIKIINFARWFTG